MSGVPNSGPVIAQWTTGSTARLTYLMLGFVPDYVIAYINHSATNPDILHWFNKGGQTMPASQWPPGAASGDAATLAPANISQWLDADDHLLTTGNGGNITRVASGIAAYFGGDVMTADQTINSNPTYVRPDGTFAQDTEVTAAGISIPAASLTANGLNLVVAWRRSQGVSPAGF